MRQPRPAAVIAAIWMAAITVVPVPDTVNAQSLPPVHTPGDPEGATQSPSVGEDPSWVIAIHGGAGVKPRTVMTAAVEAEYRATLTEALAAGGAVLERGGRAPEAVEAALVVLEDSVLFNAGRGASLDAFGDARHDASIMRGSDRDAGAIAGSSRIRNPIKAARAVMELTDNVMLDGDGADWFAADHGLDLADPLYFVTEERRNMLLEKRAADPGKVAGTAEPDAEFGTVGAVVLDRHGELAAGTSTGGRTNKRFGRIGDSPVIGAGTYASNASCAVSATGHGEFFMRWTVARDICARVEFAGESLERAAHSVVVETLKPVGGNGAVLAIDPSGKVVFSMNGEGMYRGVMSSDVSPGVAIYAEDRVR